MSVIATVAFAVVDPLGVSAPDPGPRLGVGPAPVSPAAVAPPASNVVRLRTSPGLDVPAATVTKWSVSDPRFGTVTVYVPAGRTPRETLAVALAERGFQAVA